MEKFFVVKQDSELYKEYWDWRNNVSENNKLIIDFFNKNNIFATEYYSSKDCLGIVPTVEDKSRFEKQFKASETNEGLRIFKKNSVIGKAWRILTETMTFLYCPSPAWLNKRSFGRSSSRLFDYNGILYASISAESVDMPEDTFEEIKGSAFYKVMEEISD